MTTNELPDFAHGAECFEALLALERKRSERSGCPFVLLLVDLVDRREESARIDGKLAERLFRKLVMTVRETDFVGWFREGYVAGAVLTAVAREGAADTLSTIGQRMNEEISAGIPSFPDLSLRVRVLPYPELHGIQAGCEFPAGG